MNDQEKREQILKELELGYSIGEQLSDEEREEVTEEYLRGYNL